MLFDAIKICCRMVLLLALMLAGSGEVVRGQQAKERVYATTQDKGTLGVCLFCGVSNEGAAVDNDVNTASTINVTVGVGAQAYQELIFPSGNRPSGSTGSVVKISTGNLLSISALGAITVRAYNGNTAVGDPVDAGSSLLNLLASGNQAEIFVPAPGVAYDRVRVNVNGGLLGVAANINVYHAYFLKDATNMVCDVAVDELHGISGNVGAIGGVSNPGNAVDGSESSFSTLSSAVGLLGYAQQTVIFMGSSVLGDSVRMVLSTPSALVELELLNSISIETFNGNVSNGVVAGTDGLLNLRLLSAGGNQAILTFEPPAVFDRVQLRVGGLASVLANVNLHEVTRLIPTTTEINNVVANSDTVCHGEPVTLKVNSPQTGATYTWYTQAAGGTGTTGTTFVPTNMTTGINKFYVEAGRTDCINKSPRKEVTVYVEDPDLPAILPKTICEGTTATLSIEGPNENLIYKWFTTPISGSSIHTGTTFTTDALTASSTYYIESQNPASNCVSSSRASVIVTVTPKLAPPTLNISSN